MKNNYPPFSKDGELWKVAFTVDLVLDLGFWSLVLFFS